jgi:cation-transporting ATPase 13A1
MQVSTFEAAEAIKVLPKLHRGKPEICMLERTPVRTSACNGGRKSYRTKIEQRIPSQRKGQDDLVFFSYQRDKYLFDSAIKTFARISYPCDATPALSTFQTSKGLTTTQDIERARTDFGKNVFDIPVPTFVELFSEHAVAPFFVFQVFCGLLWLLDEYIWYSVFTLFMLVVFECTTVFQRLRTISEFRSMSIKPYDILVRRENKWIEVQTDELLPGDLVSVGECSGSFGAFSPVFRP